MSNFQTSYHICNISEISMKEYLFLLYSGARSSSVQHLHNCYTFMRSMLISISTKTLNNTLYNIIGIQIFCLTVSLTSTQPTFDKQTLLYVNVQYKQQLPFSISQYFIIESPLKSWSGAQCSRCSAVQVYRSLRKRWRDIKVQRYIKLKPRNCLCDSH